MIKRFISFCTILLALVSPSSAAPRQGRAIATYYTGSVGAGGVNLNKYPSKNVYLPRIRKSVKLFPVAVYSDRVRNMKYQVVQLRKNGKSIYGHVVDECADGDCHHNSQIARRAGAVLFDLHRSAWKAMGFKSPTIEKKLVYKIVGKITRKNRAIGDLVTSDGKKNYVPRMWT